MKMQAIPFGTTDWSHIEKTEHGGIGGVAHWRTRQFNDIRVRMVEYSPGYARRPLVLKRPHPAGARGRA